MRTDLHQGSLLELQTGPSARSGNDATSAVHISTKAGNGATSAGTNPGSPIPVSVHASTDGKRQAVNAAVISQAGSTESRSKDSGSMQKGVDSAMEGCAKDRGRGAEVNGRVDACFGAAGECLIERLSRLSAAGNAQKVSQVRYDFFLKISPGSGVQP